MISSMGPETKYAEYEQTGSWALIYQNIRQESITQHNYSTKEARRPDNRVRNRYKDVSPYDHSRIVLHRHDIDYINASLIPVPEADRSYILTQGPLATTAGHFWLMVWEQNSMLILMLNRVIEKGMARCHQYFPTGEENEGDNEMLFADVDLKVTFVSEDNANYYTVRTLLLEDLTTGSTRRVLQFHYTTWPDFGVPDSPADFLHFLQAVRQSGGLSSLVGPPVVHCSAGIGRSGTFCIVDTCLVLIEQSGTAENINIYELLMRMRRYRMGLIQTPQQLKFTYLAVIEGSRLILGQSADHTTAEDQEINKAAVADISVSEAAAEVDKDEVVDRITPVDDNYKQSVELRRRNRAERIKTTSAQLEKMKLRQRQMMSARPSFWRSHATTIAASAVIIGCVVYYFYGSDIQQATPV